MLRDGKSSEEVLLAGRKEENMYTGTLIDELIASGGARGKARFTETTSPQEDEIHAIGSLPAQRELVFDSNLLGVA